MGKGEDNGKSKNLCFKLNNMPFPYLSGKHEDSCNRLHQVSQLIFAMIIDNFLSETD